MIMEFEILMSCFLTAESMVQYLKQRKKSCVLFVIFSDEIEILSHKIYDRLIQILLLYIIEVIFFYGKKRYKRYL